MGDPLNSAIERLKASGADFSRAFSLLSGDRAAAITAGRFAEWESLMRRGHMLRDMITSITRGVDTASNTVYRVLGLEGSQSLAAVPLIGIAAVLSAIAGVSYFTTEAYRLHAALGAGVKPDVLFAVRPPAIESAAGMVKWAVLGGLLLYFLRTPTKG